MSKGVTGRAYHMRWLPDEWIKVAVVAAPMIARGSSGVDAVFEAQRAALPKHRWHPLEQVKKIASDGAAGVAGRRYLDRAKAMTEAERDAVLLKPIKHPAKGHLIEAAEPAAPAATEATKAPTPSPQPREPRKPGGIEGGSLVRWTSREWALIARAAKWVSERQPELPLHAQVIEAQRWTLPPDRQRAPAGIKQAFYKGSNGGDLARQLKEGLDHGWTINTVPFEPPGTERPAPRGILPELPSVRAAEAAAAKALETIAAAPAAPTPSPGTPAPAGSLQEAANAFAAHLQSGLAALLEAHTRIIASHLESKIEGTVTSLAAVLETGMRQAVHAMVVNELGGDIAPPPAAPSAAPTSSAPTSAAANGATGSIEFIDDTPATKKLKVDIVGVPNGQLASQILENLPANVDARIFEPDSKSAYVPHKGRHCIMLIHRIPHSLSRKVKAAGVEPIFVKPTVFYVTHAVDELQRSFMQ